MDRKERERWIRQQHERRQVRDPAWYKARLGSLIERLVQVFGSDAAAKWVGDHIDHTMGDRDKYLAIQNKIESARKEK